MMKRSNRLLAVLLSAYMAVSSGGVTSADASYSSEIFDDVNSVPPLTIEEYNEICQSMKLPVELAYSTGVSLPESVDLSESPHFPPVGNQGNLGSCSAWATTYYQFTYEAHNYNCITSTKKNAYSPRWTWNLANHGMNYGISINSAYKVLSTFGAETMKECPYDYENYSYSWSDDEEAMLMALKTRVTNVNIFGISGNETAITGSNDPDLDMLKSALYNGKVVVASMNNRSYSDSMKHAVIRGNNSGTLSGTHAVAIVGYDDNYTFDINQNDIIEPFEKGALKIADSTGNFWGYDGFMYVMYDALNGISAGSGDWEDNEKYDRKAIFNVIPSDADNEDGYNIFYTIDVDNIDVNFVGEVNIDTDYRENISVAIQHKSAYGDDNYTQIFPMNDEDFTGLNIPFKGKLLIDYSNCYNSYDPYLSSFYSGTHEWYIRLGSEKKGYDINSWASDGSISCRILDSRGNLITDFEPVRVPSSSDTVTLKTILNTLPGDVNYDGDVNGLDYVTIHQYMKGIIPFSNVQFRIADIDSDGDVDDDDKESVLKQYFR